MEAMLQKICLFASPESVNCSQLYSCGLSTQYINQIISQYIFVIHFQVIKSQVTQVTGIHVKVCMK